MEMPGRQFQRVLLALEDLVAQETLLLRAEDFDALPALQARIAPLVESLIAGAASADDTLRNRVAALIECRAHSAKLLSGRLAEVRGELDAMQLSRQRIAQVKPAYRQPGDAAAVGQLRAQG